MVEALASGAWGAETDAAKVRRHVAKAMVAVGAEELRTDEHSVYQGASGNRRHRLCLSRWRKSEGKRAWDLHRRAVAEGRPLEAETMEELLEILRLQPRPPLPPEELERLVRRYINARKGLPWKVNGLLQHVERTWTQVSDDPVDPTNNATEGLIGLTLKIRAKTIRGFKSPSKVLAHPYLAGLLRAEGGICDLQKVICPGRDRGTPASSRNPHNRWDSYHGLTSLPADLSRGTMPVDSGWRRRHWAQTATSKRYAQPANGRSPYPYPICATSLTPHPRMTSFKS